MFCFTSKLSFASALSTIPGFLVGGRVAGQFANLFQADVLSGVGEGVQVEHVGVVEGQVAVGAHPLLQPTHSPPAPAVQRLDGLPHALRSTAPLVLPQSPETRRGIDYRILR